MNENCEVLLGFEATLYTAMENCNRAPKMLEDGVAEGQKCANLILKMDDIVYLDNW
jgi:hypothetical protein